MPTDPNASPRKRRRLGGGAPATASTGCAPWPVSGVSRAIFSSVRKRQRWARRIPKFTGWLVAASRPRNKPVCCCRGLRRALPLRQNSLHGASRKWMPFACRVVPSEVVDFQKQKGFSAGLIANASLQRHDWRMHPSYPPSAKQKPPRFLPGRSVGLISRSLLGYAGEALAGIADGVFREAE